MSHRTPPDSTPPEDSRSAATLPDSTLRILTALVGAPVVIGLTYLGGWPFGLLLLAAALLAQYELYGMFAAGGMRPRVGVGMAVGALVALRAFVPFALEAALIVLVLLVVAGSFFDDAEGTPASLASTTFGVVYPTLFVTFVADLRLGAGLGIDDGEAFWLTISVFLLVWATDSFAYFVGRAVGRRPLAPRVSPKKTWEGTIGGAAGALAVAVVLRLTVLDFLAWPHVVVVALLCGVLSQLGDLAESRLKRAVGVKDSGTILPGHGGVLDRIDALVVAAPLVYLYLRLAAAAA